MLTVSADLYISTISRIVCSLLCLSASFFSTQPSTTQIYPLSLHDALPIYSAEGFADDLQPRLAGGQGAAVRYRRHRACHRDRKSTRLNSSHLGISYAVFCLKKKIVVIDRQRHSDVSPLRISELCAERVYLR